MSHTYRARISKGNPPQGTIKAVVGFKDSTGGRWEFDGKLPKTVAYLVMTLCITGGKQPYAEGRDEGIEQAFGGKHGTN